MRRREFIALLCSGAAFWPADVHAQQHDKVRTIALVGDNNSVWRPWTAAFADRMRELGWIENRDVVFVYRWTEGRPEAVSDIARELVQQKVDVIVSYGGAVRSLNQATNSIPIVSRSIRLALASFRACRIPAATSRVCRFSQRILPASGLNFCVRSSLVCTGWQSSSMRVIRRPRVGIRKFRPPPTRLALKSRRMRFGKRRILPPSSML